MGKTDTINSLSRIISNIAIHEILLEYTNRPESINHLSYEVIEYSNVAFSKAEEFNWNSKDISKIKSKAIKIFKKEMPKRYPDVNYPEEKVGEIIDKIIREII